MNILINTPYFKTTTLNEDLDNKVLMIFIVLISTLIVLGVIFLRLINIPPAQLNDENFPNDNPSDSLHTLITV